MLFTITLDIFALLKGVGKGGKQHMCDGPY